jgi:molecular chaperone DnaK (HSP70)
MRSWRGQGPSRNTLERIRTRTVDHLFVTAVLLVGGSSRIPLVSRMVSAELGRPTAVDAHPKHAIVLGAAAMSGRAMATVQHLVGGGELG